MNAIDQIKDFIKEHAQAFGATAESESAKEYVWRDNTGEEALKDNGAFFGFISPDNETGGTFHDFSYTIFPTPDERAWLCCLGIGSEGFKNDYELASQPGVRRLFRSLLREKSFCKTSFLDIESGVTKEVYSYAPHLTNTIKKYAKVLPAIQVIQNPLTEQGKNILSAFLAGYARIRQWPKNNTQRKAVEEAIQKLQRKQSSNDFAEALHLLHSRRFVVLQGAPGTGKTRLAKELAKAMSAKVFFTQFHAETSYSDFIYGIVPNVDAEQINYTEKKGVFMRALDYAIENPNEKVVLIIDEINRANLSSVLGPAFYLFEYQNGSQIHEIEIGGGRVISEIPKNLYVVGTMNTADRSLAVVDFALRRRFAWYTLLPQKPDIQNFFESDFNEFQNIFYWYASQEELNLQPGHAFFIADSNEEMVQRLKYELLPLIREYLAEGIMIKAKEEFNQYFTNRVNIPLEQ